MKCFSCSKKMTAKIENYHYKESGIDDVYIETKVFRCNTCKEIMAELPNMQELHHVIAMALVNKNAKLSGREIRFLRKQLSLKAKDLGIILSVTQQTVSRWENDKEEISQYNDKLIRLVYVQTMQEKCDKVFKSVLEIMKKINPTVRKRKIMIPRDKIKEEICNYPSLAAM